MLADKLRAATAAAGGVEPVGIDFDGTNDYLSRSSDLVGNADGKTFTFSAWVYTLDTAENNRIYQIDNDVFIVYVNSDNSITVGGKNSTGTFILLSNLGVAENVPPNTWCHVLISIDLSNTSNRHVYINDQSVTGTWSTYTNDNLDFTKADHFIGSDELQVPNVMIRGRLAGVYLDYTYRDLSVEANRRDFIDADGRYVTPPTSGIISVPMDDPDDPGRNDGTGGDFTLNGVVAQAGRGPNQYNAPASTFDGSADYLSGSTAPTDGKQFIYSVWFKPTASDISGNRFVTQWSGSTAFACRVLSGGDFRFSSTSTVGADAYEFESSNQPIVADKWYNLAISADMSDSGKRHIYLNGTSATGTYNAYNNLTLDFTSANQYVARDGGANYWGGEISDLYIEVNDYLDLSASNPFYDTETGKPKFLGVDGSEPTGSAPLIYLPLRADDAGSNKGTGGDFTVNSGPYTGARGPSEYWANSAEFNGTSQTLSKTSAFSGASDTTTMTMAIAYKADTAASGDYILTLRKTGGYPKWEFNTNGTTSTSLTVYGPGTNLTSKMILNIPSSLSVGNWYTLLVSVDMTNTSKRHCYLNGTYTGSWIAYDTSYTFELGTEVTESHIASQGNPASFGFDGRIGFLYLSTEYIDFSQEANRLKFFDAFNYPVDLGEDGSLPTGNQPLIYMNNDFHLGTNLGSGGNFTPQNTPTDGGYVKG